MPRNILCASKKLLFTSTLFFAFLFCRAQPKTEILWDNYGIPHIYAGSVSEMYYAAGWAQMHSHANLILQLYGQARGRASEYWGKKYVLSDRQILLFDLPGQA